MTADRPGTSQPGNVWSLVDIRGIHGPSVELNKKGVKQFIDPLHALASFHQVPVSYTAPSILVGVIVIRSPSFRT